HTNILLSHYGIKCPTTSFYQHNRLAKAPYLLRLLQEGKSVALVSDAGTPGILDPGYNIINLAIKNNIEITAIPGAAAFINALVLSGKPAHKFIFEGFLPNKPVSRRNRLKELAQLKHTLIFYESCHRILATLEDISAVFGEKEIACCRELTKKFEEVIWGNAKEVLDKLKSQKPRGEFVVII
ncbi:MAG: 16S rRNA (cytidine(1402)-2'-O)-methyltransferase, partial [bacterium]|nr:16S rRNA (cytidine(1402)-2'-O)-methyltransferase [bacterium]